jgi:hypothetical protein
MKERLLILNHALLFLCASMYLGTGGSLVLFSFPIAPQLTTQNYYLQFVPQVTAATAFFTTMTKVMLATACIMLFAEWRQVTRWVPIVVLLSVIASTVLTLIWIFPLNQAMADHIQDPGQLKTVLSAWMNLNRIRAVLWLIQWCSLMAYFAYWARRGRYAKGFFSTP